MEMTCTYHVIYGTPASVDNFKSNLYSRTILFCSIDTVCEPTTEREVFRDVYKQGLA